MAGVVQMIESPIHHPRLQMSCSQSLHFFCYWGTLFWPGLFFSGAWHWLLCGASVPPPPPPWSQSSLLSPGIITSFTNSHTNLFDGLPLHIRSEGKPTANCARWQGPDVSQFSHRNFVKMSVSLPAAPDMAGAGWHRQVSSIQLIRGLQRGNNAACFTTLLHYYHCVHQYSNHQSHMARILVPILNKLSIQDDNRHQALIPGQWSVPRPSPRLTAQLASGKMRFQLNLCQSGAAQTK